MIARFYIVANKHLVMNDDDSVESFMAMRQVHAVPLAGPEKRKFVFNKTAALGRSLLKIV